MAPRETKGRILRSLKQKNLLSSIKNLFRKKPKQRVLLSEASSPCRDPPSRILTTPPPEAVVPSAHCKLCLEDSTDMYTLAACSCTFCRQCIQTYIEVKIKEGDVQIGCPDSSCRIQGQFQDDEIRSLLPNSLKYLYEKLKLNAEVASDPNRCWCPGKRCEAICYMKIIKPGEVVPVFCPSCSLMFCSGCKRRWHPRRTCTQLSEHLEQINRLGQSGNIKYCPKCIVPIEHIEGCAQMVCKQCHHIFCWHCLQSLQGDLFLRHYDEGPCKDKLGHPRIGLFVHRFGTYATYAALTVAILFGAPLLIVCLPCLLCVFSLYNRMPPAPAEQPKSCARGSL